MTGAAAQSPHTHQHSFGDAEKWAHVFDDPERDAWQKPHEVISALALRPDAAVADLGAGTAIRGAPGQHAAEGDRLRGRCRARDGEVPGRAGEAPALKNLKPVGAQPDDARLPVKVDLILLVDVYHHIENRDGYFRRLAASLSPAAGSRGSIFDSTRRRARRGGAHRAREGQGRAFGRGLCARRRARLPAAPVFPGVPTALAREHALEASMSRIETCLCCTSSIRPCGTPRTGGSPSRA